MFYIILCQCLQILLAYSTKSTEEETPLPRYNIWECVHTGTSEPLPHINKHTALFNDFVGVSFNNSVKIFYDNGTHS